MNELKTLEVVLKKKMKRTSLALPVQAPMPVLELRIANLVPHVYTESFPSGS